MLEPQLSRLTLTATRHSKPVGQAHHGPGQLKLYRARVLAGLQMILPLLRACFEMFIFPKSLLDQIPTEIGNLVRTTH